MSEHRFTLIETTQADHGRRITDHDGKLQALLNWKDAIEESTEVNRKMVEVGENLLLALSWVGIAAKWIVAVGAALGAVWMAFKAMVHLGAK